MLAAVKLAEGNRAKVARSKIGVDLKAKGRAEPPEGLGDDERQMWRDITTSLPVDLLAKVDVGILERHVVAWARYRQCQERIGKMGLMVKSPRGWQRNPLIGIQTAAAKEMHQTGAELGLSPVARARLNQPATPPGDPMDYLYGMDEGEPNDRMQ